MSKGTEICQMMNIQPDLAFEFFAVFSRTEYALKATQYRCKEKAEPCWDIFANRIDKDLQNIDDEKLKYAISYLQKYPPKIQKIENDKLVFKEPPISRGQKTTQQILLSIRRVRNNLFHGGKSERVREQRKRNECLVEQSLIILNACVDIDNDVYQKFHE